MFLNPDYVNRRSPKSQIQVPNLKSIGKGLGLGLTLPITFIMGNVNVVSGKDLQ